MTLTGNGVLRKIILFWLDFFCKEIYIMIFEKLELKQLMIYRTEQKIKWIAKYSKKNKNN